MTKQEAEAIVAYVQAAIEARHTLEGAEREQEEAAKAALYALVAEPGPRFPPPAPVYYK